MKDSCQKAARGAFDCSDGSAIKIKLIDAHAHLVEECFREDLEEVLERSRQVGLELIICVSQGLEDAEQVLRVAKEHDMVVACLGLHPDRADLDSAQELAGMIREHRDELVGIGEVGLDYWVAKDEPARAEQRAVLSLFAELSRELDLPLNVHSRSAGHHTISLLSELSAQKVLLHAFDGKAARALLGVEAGYYFSVGPSIVRSPQKQKLVRALPLSALLLETDSPVLGPDKEKRNEPANLVIAAEAVAELKGCPLEEVISMTSDNARKLFALSAVANDLAARAVRGHP